MFSFPLPAKMAIASDGGAEEAFVPPVGSLVVMVKESVWRLMQKLLCTDRWIRWVISRCYRPCSYGASGEVEGTSGEADLETVLWDRERFGVKGQAMGRKGDLEDIRNWRLIALLNIDYKILASILTKKLGNIAGNYCILVTLKPSNTQ